MNATVYMITLASLGLSVTLSQACTLYSPFSLAMSDIAI